MNTNEYIYAYSTGSSMWFTNFNLPNGWDRRGARNHLNPDNCVLDGCYIMPSPYNGKTYIGHNVIAQSWEDVVR